MDYETMTKDKVKKLVVQLKTTQDCEKVFEACKKHNAPLWFLGMIAARNNKIMKEGM